MSEEQQITDTPQPEVTFSEYNFHPALKEGLESFNFNKPTPIQAQSIPSTMNGRDMIGVAQTGTGKTAAFLLPVMHRILQDPKPGEVNALIIVPTRELAVQVDTQCQGFSYFTGLSSIAIYGGGDGNTFDYEKKALTQGAEIVIATPGRLISHLNLGYVKFSNVQTLVLDEADRMLDMGFYDDLMKIINHIPAKRQTMLFSATMPPKIRLLADKLLNDPVRVSIAVSRPAEKIRQGAYLVYEPQKVPMLEHILTKQGDKTTIIFSGSKRMVKELNFTLRKKHFKAAAIHSDLEQNERENILLDFRNRKRTILVATDVLSRGIDIEGIDMVINFDIPADGEDYVHRIGRTARASAEGEAISLVNERDQKYFQRVETLIGREIEKYPNPPEIGEGPAWEPAKGRGSRPPGKGGGFNKGRSNGKRFKGKKPSPPGNA